MSDQGCNGFVLESVAGRIEEVVEAREYDVLRLVAQRMCQGLCYDSSSAQRIYWDSTAYVPEYAEYNHLSHDLQGVVTGFRLENTFTHIINVIC